MRSVCCVCRKIKTAAGWTGERAQGITHPDSHGYCPACAAAVVARLRASLEEQRRVDAKFGAETNRKTKSAERKASWTRTTC